MLKHAVVEVYHSFFSIFSQQNVQKNVNLKATDTSLNFPPFLLSDGKLLGSGSGYWVRTYKRESGTVCVSVCVAVFTGSTGDMPGFHFIKPQ